ncbi:Ig-like domain-containing protein [Brevibacillus laterosporus]
MQKDNSVQLTLNAEYMDGSTKDVTDLANWSPESSTIAQVDANGMVKAKGSGKVDISASFGNKTVKIPVEVDITASLTSNTKNVFMSVGEKVQIKLNPDAADSNYITDQAEWSSSSSKVAEVTKGEIRAYSNGKTTITARYGGKSVSILVEVDVLQGLVANTRLVRLKTLGDVKDIQTKVTLMATLTGGRTVDMTDQAEWKVSSYKVAEANKGTIKAIGYGKTTVTARYGGKSVTVYVEVDQLKYLKTNHVQLNMKVGETKQVNATATYLDGIDRDVTKPALWTTPKVTIADVKDGIIKATGVGRTVITVSYGDKKTQVIVNVTK